MVLAAITKKIWWILESITLTLTQFSRTFAHSEKGYNEFYDGITFFCANSKHWCDPSFEMLMNSIQIAYNYVSFDSNSFWYVEIMTRARAYTQKNELKWMFKPNKITNALW